MKTEKQRFDELHTTLSEQGKLIPAHRLIERAARTWPNNIVVICQDQQMTYQELYKRSSALAHTLRSYGVKKGERVIIYYENSIEFYIAYYAVWLAGAVVAPLNVFLSEHELIKIIQDAQPVVVIISPHLEEKLLRYPGQLPHVITHIDKKGTVPDIEPLPLGDIDNTDVAAILYTSGTTGFPKGVMLSSLAIVTNAIQAIARFEFEEQERVFCPLPLFHSLPQNVCMWSTTVVGATAVIVPKIERKTIIKGIAHAPTIVVAVPALYGLFCLLRTLRFPRVKYFFAGGDALSDKIRSAFALIYKRKICNGYGLTETSPFLSVDIDDYTKPTSNVGEPFIGMHYSIRNDQGKELSRGKIGTLWVRGANVMLGYYKAPQATAAILQDGWLNTGDLAYIDGVGKIVLAGRERDLISNKGLKIYPQEVENILLSHPHVLQAAVIGIVEDEEEIPVAFVASKEKSDETLIAELRALCGRNLAGYKIPRRFYVRNELPVTSTGKVDKKVLKAELLSS